MRIFTSRAIAVATAAGIALTTLGIESAAAGWRHRDDAAALTAFGAVLGTIAAVIVADRHRDRVSHAPAYGHGPVYYRPFHVHGPYGHWRHRHHW